MLVLMVVDILVGSFTNTHSLASCMKVVSWGGDIFSR